MATRAGILFSALIFLAGMVLAPVAFSGQPDGKLHQPQATKGEDAACNQTACPGKATAQRLSTKTLDVEEMVTPAQKVGPRNAPALSVFTSSEQRKEAGQLRRLRLLLLQFAVTRFYSL